MHVSVRDPRLHEEIDKVFEHRALPSKGVHNDAFQQIADPDELSWQYAPAEGRSRLILPSVPFKPTLDRSALMPISNLARIEAPSRPPGFSDVALGAI